MMTGEHLDDLLAGDYEAFAECEAAQGTLREGDWSPFSVLGWIASRGDADFVAAVQRYEMHSHANRGGLHSSAAWVVLGNIAGMRFDTTFTDASNLLREKLESGDLEGGTAIARGPGGKLELVPRHLWRQWSCSFENEGLVLLPGLVDFSWPSAAVRSAFPAVSARVPESAPIPAKWSDDLMFAAIAKCGFSNREKAWREHFKPLWATHRWGNEEFRLFWSHARNTKGMTGRPPKDAD